MELDERIASWESLSRWERSELGKDLRRTGLSYGEIMDLIPVKKSTLATWCREVRLTEEHWEAIKARTGSQAGYRVTRIESAEPRSFDFEKMLERMSPSGLATPSGSPAPCFIGPRVRRLRTS